MLGTRLHRYSMNWPYWNGLISPGQSGARVTRTGDRETSTCSRLRPSNQAVPVPFPKPAKKRQRRTRPSAGAWKYTDSRTQSALPSWLAPLAIVPRPPGFWTCKVPSTGASTLRKVSVRTQPLKRCQAPPCTATSWPRAVSDGSAAERRRACRPSWAEAGSRVICGRTP